APAPLQDGRDTRLHLVNRVDQRGQQRSDLGQLGVGHGAGHGRFGRSALALRHPLGVPPSSNVLVASRVIQGVMAALMFPQALSVIQV
ncbi:MAG TPA: hypothetical protein VKK19_08430, partial [Candidatus Dormibacteraeota bacterium]|nr:hypothetical protein [Candidatus Dormibacteraeota bacterium]